MSKGYISSNVSKTDLKELFDGLAFPVFAICENYEIIFANKAFTGLLTKFRKRNHTPSFRDFFYSESISEINELINSSNSSIVYSLSFRSDILINSSNKPLKVKVRKSKINNKDVFLFTCTQQVKSDDEEKIALENYLNQVLSISSIFSSKKVIKNNNDLSVLTSIEKILDDHVIVNFLNTLSKTVCKALDGEKCLIWVKANEKLVVCGEYGVNNKYVGENNLNLSINESLIGAFLNSQDPKLIRDLTTNRKLKHKRFPIDENVNDLFLIPMVLEDINIGAINVFYSHANEISFTQRNIAKSLGIISATILENILLIQELNKLQEENTSMLYRTFDTPEKQFFKPLGAMVNHEIGNFLNLFNILLERLLTDQKFMNKLNASLQKNLKSIHMKLLASIQMVLQMSDFFTTKDSQNDISINIYSAVRKAVSFLTPKITEHDIEVLYDSKINEDVSITGNEMEFLLVIFNFLTNSIKAIIQKNRNTSPIGTIEINIKKTKDKGFVIITIIDNGIGIPNEVINKIWKIGFTNFQTKSGGKSTGLGLYGCLEIIKNDYKGSISVDASVSRGATFNIRLPLI